MARSGLLCNLLHLARRWPSQCRWLHGGEVQKKSSTPAESIPWQAGPDTALPQARMQANSNKIACRPAKEKTPKGTRQMLCASRPRPTEHTQAPVTEFPALHARACTLIHKLVGNFICTSGLSRQPGWPATPPSSPSSKQGQQGPPPPRLAELAGPAAARRHGPATSTAPLW